MIWHLCSKPLNAIPLSFRLNQVSFASSSAAPDLHKEEHELDLNSLLALGCLSNSLCE